MLDATLTDQKVQSFMNGSSFSGLLAIYALKLSHDKKIAFDRNDIVKDAYLSSADYLYGYTVCSSAFGLLSHNFKNNVITVTEINPFLSSAIEQSVIAKASSIDKRLETIEKVKKYFT